MRTRTKGTIALVVVLLLLGLIVYVQSALACRCTPGFWKNHTDLWGCADWAPGDPVSDVFDVPVGLDLNGDGVSDTLLDALQYGGGPDVEGAARNLLRSGVAALLNEQCHYKWFADNYGYDVYPIESWPFYGDTAVDLVDEALNSGSRGTMLTLHRMLDTWNNDACKEPCDSWPDCPLEPTE